MLTSGRGREARLYYLAGTFRMLGAGDYVRCAETGTHIPLEQLRYWSVERQEAYIDADAAHAADRRAAAGGTSAR